MEKSESVTSVEETARYIHLMQGLPELSDEIKSKIQEYIGKIPDLLAGYKSDSNTRDMIDAAMKQKRTRDIEDKDALLIASLLSSNIEVESDSKERFLPAIGAALLALGPGEAIAMGGLAISGLTAGYAAVASLWKKE
jgi:hypothetical protein